MSSPPLSGAKLADARAQCICQVNFMRLKKIPLTADKVLQVIDNFCIELRRPRTEMPSQLVPLYQEAEAKPGKLFDSTNLIAQLNQAA